MFLTFVNAPAGARDRDRSRRHARPGRPAAGVLVLGLLLLGAAAAEAQTAPTVVAVSKVSADGTYNLGETISLPVVFSASDGTTGMSHHLQPNPPRLRAHSPGDYFHRRTGRSVVVEATHPAMHARPGGSTGGFTFASQEAPSC